MRVLVSIFFIIRGGHSRMRLLVSIFIIRGGHNSVSLLVSICYYQRWEQHHETTDQYFSVSKLVTTS